MKKIKNILLFSGLPLLAVVVLFMTSAGGAMGATAAHDWYFKPNDRHLPPQVTNEVPLEGMDVLYCGDGEQKKVSITFDAGYDEGTHAAILDTLKEKEVRAAFFLDGNFLKKNEALVRRMAAEGQTIGNHTLNHADMTRLTDFATYRAQIDGWNEILESYGIAPSGYFRFPQGRFSERALEYNQKLGLKSVFWSFAYYDWVAGEQPEPEAALEKIMSRMHNGCVLLLHSTSETNVSILGRLIDRLRAEGYAIVPLSEMQ